MTIGKVINDYGINHSPYMGNLVNHLPMGQLALYQMTHSLDKVEEYSRFFTRKSAIDPVDTNVNPVDSLKDCVGKRNLYAACLLHTQAMVREKGVDASVREVLNQYPLGMSSGLFHVLIRLAYAVEGAGLEKDLAEEVARALAYYVTAYREVALLERRIPASDVADELTHLAKNPVIQQGLQRQPSLGKKMKFLYDNDVYKKEGFLIRGEETEKVPGLLSALVPVFMQSNNIVVLHCITGLHALLTLKLFFDDFEESLDIYTTCCLTHLLTVENLDDQQRIPEKTKLDWKTLFQEGSESRDVHTIKFTYTGHQLENTHGYDKEKLREAVRFRIEKNG